MLVHPGEWRNYPHFSSGKGITSLFYWHRALNLKRFGPCGTSTLLGGGGYAMANCCHYCRGPLYAYWKAGAVTVVAAMFTWWLTHLVWFGNVRSGYGLVVMLAALFSTPFYANLFARQNYNAVGWSLFPLVLFGLYTGNWIVFSLSVFAVSFASLTVVAIAAALAFAQAVSLWTVWPLLAVVPALLKGSSHLRPCFGQGSLLATLGVIAKMIGASHTNVKYTRRRRSLDLGDTYICVLLAIVVGVSAWVGGGLSPLAAMALILVLANSSFLRFADYQTSQMLALSIAVAECMRLESLWMLLGAMPLMTALPGLVAHTTFSGVFDVFPVVRPFNVGPLLGRVNAFLDPVPAGARVLTAYDDPQGEYNRVFDGYRVLHEAICYAGGARDITVLPDWAAISVNNYEGAPGFWGRDPASVRENLERWQCDFAVVYTIESQPLDPSWEADGFEILASMDWAELGPILQGRIPTKKPPPKWWLVRPVKRGASG